MILTREQMKHLTPDGDELFKVLNVDQLSKTEKEELFEMDAGYYEVYQYHIITNWKDLK